MDKNLHIVSFDIPYPANYGGIIDVFHRIKHLHKLGVKIILHCFEYGHRKPNALLNDFCEKVHYYKRKTGILGLHASLPYIVSSRIDHLLLKNLLVDNAPILFEGTHTAYFASHPSLADRKKILRAHNIESAYYSELAKNEKSVWKKLYYYLEAKRLQRYEPSLHCFEHIACVSKQDFDALKHQYPKTNIHLIPSSHANDNVTSYEGSGSYCLYHGNLEVAENIRAVNYLIDDVFNHLNIPLVIAGKNPSTELLSKAKAHISFVSNPSDLDINKLLQEAHINVLPTFQDTGLKLKFLYALFVGRHCLLNTKAIDKSLYPTLYIAETTEKFIEKINSLMQIPFSKEDILIRQKSLLPFSNAINAQLFLNLI